MIENLFPTEGIEDLEKLQKMIGLDDIKSEVHAVFDTHQEFPNYKFPFHYVFTGNSGTGKFEAAKLIGSIYKSFGFLSSGHVVRATPYDFLNSSPFEAEAAAVTQSGEIITSGKRYDPTKKIRDSMGGVLFISSIKGFSHPEMPKDVALHSLKQPMDNNLGRWVVILADEKIELDNFFDNNTLLHDFFPEHRRLNFPDFNDNELLGIFQKFAADYQYVLDKNTMPKLREHFEQVHATRDQSFGNGREVRNFFEAVVRNQSVRLVQEGLTSRESLMQIKFDDLEL